MRVAYLCDGRADCGCSPGCAVNGGSMSLCWHTTRPEHAVNGTCDHPEREPERFEEVRTGTFQERRKFTND